MNLITLVEFMMRVSSCVLVFLDVGFKTRCNYIQFGWGGPTVMHGIQVITFQPPQVLVVIPIWMM